MLVDFDQLAIGSAVGCVCVVIVSGKMILFGNWVFNVYIVLIIALITTPSMAGQSINDRLTAARYSIAGQGLAKSVCKATTEEVNGPKKKHLDCKFDTVSIKSW